MVVSGVENKGVVNQEPAVVGVEYEKGARVVWLTN